MTEERSRVGFCLPVFLILGVLFVLAVLGGAVTWLRMGPGRAPPRAAVTVPFHRDLFSATRKSATRNPDGTWTIAVTIANARPEQWAKVELGRAMVYGRGIMTGAKLVSSGDAKQRTSDAVFQTDEPIGDDPKDARIEIGIAFRGDGGGGTDTLRVALRGAIAAKYTVTAEPQEGAEFRMRTTRLARREDGSWTVTVSVGTSGVWHAAEVREVFVYSRSGDQTWKARCTSGPPAMTFPAKLPAEFPLTFETDPLAGVDDAVLRYTLETGEVTGLGSSHSTYDDADVALVESSR
jgi:hypothetical protein